MRAGLGLGLDNLHLIDVQDIDQAGGPNGDVKTEQGIEKDDIRRGLHATSLDSMNHRAVDGFRGALDNLPLSGNRRGNLRRGVHVPG